MRASGNNLYLLLLLFSSDRVIKRHAIGRFTVTSHAETRDRLLRLVGKTVKLAAIFIVFKIVRIYNYGGVVCCCGVY